MSTNLRLSDELAAALRREAIRTGRSQQDIVREAIALKLGLLTSETPLQRAVREGRVRAPSPFQDVAPPFAPLVGRSSLDLLDREDRV